MTRINANIPPKRLTDQMLLAEHREIKLAKVSKENKEFKNKLQKLRDILE